VFFTILQGMAVDVYREEGQLELNTVAEECLWRAARAGNTTILLYLPLRTSTWTDRSHIHPCESRGSVVQAEKTV